MKNFLASLLIFFSLCLCGLIWFQWVREASSRQEIQSLHDKDFLTREEIQGLRATVRRTEEEVMRLDGLKIELTGTVKSNRQEIATLTKDLQHANAEAEARLRQIEVYKEALDRANESIKKQNEDVRRQNEEMRKLADERNEIVVKFNKVVADFNDLAGKWNTLQEKLAGTNAPPANPPKPAK